MESVEDLKLFSLFEYKRRYEIAELLHNHRGRISIKKAFLKI